MRSRTFPHADALQRLCAVLTICKQTPWQLWFTRRFVWASNRRWLDPHNVHPLTWTRRGRWLCIRCTLLT
jgi:hypothetical protein